MKKLIISLCFAFLSVLHGQAGNEDTINVSAIKIPPLNKIKNSFVNLIIHKYEEDSLPAFNLYRPNVHQYGKDSVRINWQRWIEATDTSMIQSYLASLNANGSFSDVDYSPVDVGDWGGNKHVERILSLSVYYKLFNKPPGLMSSIKKAVNNWCNNNYKSGQWWTDTVYIPRILGQASLIIDSNLDGCQRYKILNILNRSQYGGEGQERVWQAQNRLMAALLQDDSSGCMYAKNIIFSVLEVDNTKDGIQSDWCFHQHNHTQEFGNHGLIFIEDIAMLSRVFEKAGVPSYYMTKNQYHIFNSLIREGYRYILWHGLMDVPSIGRTVTKDRQRLAALYTGRVAKRMYNFQDSACRRTGEMILRENFMHPDFIQPFAGHKHFFRSDYTVHRTPQWMTSVKMASNRVIGTELMSGNNLYGYYQGDGATYTQVNGNEYLYIFPLWDWRKIPGITCYDTTDPIRTDWKDKARNNSNLVGGITVENGGITAMELNRDSLKAHKVWIFTDSCMLCLGYVFASPGAKTTSIEQCNRQNDLRHLNENDWVTITDSAQYTNDKPLYFFHNNIGYVSWNDVTAITKQRHGCWGDFMSTYTKNDKDTGNVVSLYISHPDNQASTYQYMLLPAMSQQDVRNFNLERIKVLRNDSIMQAVLIDDKLYITAFAAGSVTAANREYNITVPGVYCYDEILQPFRTMRN